MKLSIIAAAAENGVIGQAGQIPWRLPAEMAYFRKVTTGKPVIMGRKTYESIGRPLPGRLNVVVTSQPDYRLPDEMVVADSLTKALEIPGIKTAGEVFIIGGQQLYEAAMPLADELYLTDVHAVVEGDTFFKYEPGQWKQVWSEEHPADAENKFGFSLKRLIRK